MIDVNALSQMIAAWRDALQELALPPVLLDDMGTDARKWAQTFVDRFGGDEGLMIGWFANAIEAGRMAGMAQGYPTEQPELPLPPEPPVGSMGWHDGVPCVRGDSGWWKFGGEVWDVACEWADLQPYVPAVPGEQPCDCDLLMGHCDCRPVTAGA